MGRAGREQGRQRWKGDDGRETAKETGTAGRGGTAAVGGVNGGWLDWEAGSRGSCGRPGMSGGTPSWGTERTGSRGKEHDSGKMEKERAAGQTGRHRVTRAANGVTGQDGWDGKHGFRIKSGMTAVRAGDGAGMTNRAVTGPWVGRRRMQSVAESAVRTLGGPGIGTGASWTGGRPSMSGGTSWRRGTAERAEKVEGRQQKQHEQTPEWVARVATSGANAAWADWGAAVRCCYDGPGMSTGASRWGTERTGTRGKEHSSGKTEKERAAGQTGRHRVTRAANGVIGQGGWDGKHGFRIKSGMTVVRAGDGAGMTNWAVTGATGWVPANAERGGVGRPDAGRAWHRDRGVMDRGWTHTVRRDLSAC